MTYLQTILLLTIILLLLRKSIIVQRKSSSTWLVDSCTLIDGRVYEIVQSGFFEGIVLIPDVVLEELQMLADGNDAHKRSRARFGLDVALDMQKLDTVKVKVLKSDRKNGETVDDFLIRAAQSERAKLITLDFNLIKVASVKGVVCLNINDLTQKLRPVILPGERARVKIIQKGSERQQGVAYLDDGTMVVVENAANKIGKTLDIEVQRYIQTDSGKMVFANTLKQQSTKN